MSFAIGIIGLPNAGKSTLFKALTGQQVEIAPYVFSTRDPNIGIVAVPDERLEKIAKMLKPEKITPTTIKFVDIAGLVKNAHKGEGLGNQFLSHIRNCDLVVEVVRGFEDDRVEHVEGTVNPQRDMEIIKNELLMKDLETLEQKKELKAIKNKVAEGKLISELILSKEERQAIKEYQLLTEKPLIYVLNCSQPPLSGSYPDRTMMLNLKMEEEIGELSAQEARDLGLEPHLAQLIKTCYNALELITFFTVTGGKETRAWTLKKGAKAAEAGGAVHSDFEQNFIRAKVISWQDLLEGKPWRVAGKEYMVQDGDVIEFKI